MPRPTLKNLKDWFQNFDVTPEQLKELRRRLLAGEGSRKGADDALEFANALLGGFGVEAIRGDYHVDNYYFEIVALYVNTGDTYSPTILYETDKQRFLVTTWGDWVEKNQKRYRIE